MIKFNIAYLQGRVEFPTGGNMQFNALARERKQTW